MSQDIDVTKVKSKGITTITFKGHFSVDDIKRLCAFVTDNIAAQQAPETDRAGTQAETSQPSQTRPAA